MTKSGYNVRGMSCSHCVKAVESAVKELPGVEKVDVSLKKSTSQGEVRREQSRLEAIKEAIREAGYDAD